MVGGGGVCFTVTKSGPPLLGLCFPSFWLNVEVEALQRRGAMEITYTSGPLLCSCLCVPRRGVVCTRR